MRPGAALASAALITAQDGALVFHEEQIFRGYSFDTLRRTLGLPAAIAPSTARFVRDHGPGWRCLSAGACRGAS